MDVNRSGNLDNRTFNGGIIGFVADASKLASVTNSVSLGNMAGDDDNVLPNKFISTTEDVITGKLTKCYECTESTGKTNVTESTAGHLNTISRSNLNKEFYQNLGFDEEIWNLDNINDKGYPELR